MTFLNRWTAALLLPPLPALAGLQPDEAEAEPPLAPYSEPYVEPGTSPTESAVNNLLSEADFLKLGLSFMAGLACGYALKVAFRLAVVVVLAIVLGIAGLQYGGLVQIDWASLQGNYGTWADWLSFNSGTFLDYIRDHLSGSASFFVGLVVGLKL